MLGTRSLAPRGLALCGLLAAMLCAASAHAAEARSWREAREAIRLAAPLETFRLPVVADTSIVDYRGEHRDNHGGRKRIRIKGIQHFWLGRIDAAALAGYTVERAELRLKRARGKLFALVDGSSSTAWVEGAGAGRPIAGAASFESPGPDGRTWAGPGSDFLSAVFGEGGSIRPGHYRPVTLLDGWYTFVLSPAVAQAQIVDSHGIVLADAAGETGANKDVWSRDTFDPGFRPRVTIEARRFDTWAPAAPTGFRVEPKPLEAGVVRVHVVAPGGDGDDGRAFGYRLEYGEDATPLARHQIDRPAAAGDAQWFDVSLPPTVYGRQVRFAIRAYDGAGNESPGAVARVRIPSPVVTSRLAARATGSSPAPALDTSGLVLWAAGEDEKIDPASPLAAQAARSTGSVVWTGAGVHLRGARNEVLGFQLAVEGRGAVAVTIGDLLGPGGARVVAARDIALFREWYVQAGDGAWHAANAIPYSPGTPLPLRGAGNGVEAQVNQALWVDLFVPGDAPPGRYEGTIRVSDVEVPLAVEVWNIRLPDAPSYRLELNGYGYVRGFDVDIDSEAYTRVLHRTHQLAHAHRATVNLLPYDQGGRIWSRSGAPSLTKEAAGVEADGWRGFDTRHGPLFDGTLFTAAHGYRGPGEGVPVAHAYLPFHENWPAPIERYYLGARDFGTTEADYRRALRAHAAEAPRIEQAWKGGYVEATRRVLDAFARHIAEKGWSRTEFQLYLNNKYYWKNDEWLRRLHGRLLDRATGSSYWLLDEPRQRRDFHALAWFLRGYREAVALRPPGSATFVQRIDISRPQYDWGVLDGAVDLYAVSGAFYRYNRALREKAERNGARIWVYGGAPPVEEPLVGYRLFHWRAWMLGADGALPTYTAFPPAGTGWGAPERLAIVLSGAARGVDGPVASLRLKAQRRAVQDVEYLNLLATRIGRDRVAARLARTLDPVAVLDAARADDPGRIRFSGVTGAELQRVRAAIAEALGG
jgi:hypothetical protein